MSDPAVPALQLDVGGRRARLAEHDSDDDNDHDLTPVGGCLDSNSR